MSQKNIGDIVHIEYKTLFIMCKYCFYISIFLIPVSIISFFKWPLYPSNILDLLVNDKIGGVLSLDSLYFIGTFVSIPIFLFYYLTTRTMNKSLALIAVILGFMGLTCLYCSRPIIEMVKLSTVYENSDSEIIKNTLIDHSLILLTFFRGTAFNIHYALGNISLLITSLLMKDNKYYNKTISYTGIITLSLSFAYYIPTVGVYISTISVIGYIVWWVLTIKKIKDMLSTET